MAASSLYHYFLTVRLQPSESGAPEAVVESRHPAGDLPKAENTLMNMITQFCFPDKEKFPKMTLSGKSAKFTFVVTNIEGVKRFGYCRRSLTGSILEAAARLEPREVTDLMTQLRAHSLPAPGDAIYATIAVGSDPATQRLEPFRFSRPEQEVSLSGFADFTALLTSIDPFTIATILVALLMERRVIFISRKLSTLSSCVQACVALLYPFTWQHVFIPVLPLAMIQFVCAPVPFVVGLLESHLPDLQAQAELMDEVILIDVESSSPVPPTSDYKLVPEKFLLPLVAAIAKARKLVLEEKRRNDKKSVGQKLGNFAQSIKTNLQGEDKNRRSTMALAELYRENQPQDNIAKVMENAFISFFAETMGHYTNFLSSTEFDKASFLNYDPLLTPFLRGVSGSQLFEQFIVHRQQSSRIKDKSALHPPITPKALTSPRADLNTDAKLSEVVIRDGYLAKWGKGMKGTAWARLKDANENVGTFQLRYWKLTYWTLTYHKTEDSKPAGSIALSDVEDVSLVEWRNGKECLEIKTADRVFSAHTENSADLNWWVEVLQWRVSIIKELSGLGKTASNSSTATSSLSASTSTSPGPSPPGSYSTGNQTSASSPASIVVPQNQASTAPAPTSAPLPTGARTSTGRPPSRSIMHYVNNRLSNKPPNADGTAPGSTNSAALDPTRPPKPTQQAPATPVAASSPSIPRSPSDGAERSGGGWSTSSKSTASQPAASVRMGVKGGDAKPAETKPLENKGAEPKRSNPPPIPPRQSHPSTTQSNGTSGSSRTASFSQSEPTAVRPAHSLSVSVAPKFGAPRVTNSSRSYRHLVPLPPEKVSTTTPSNNAPSDATAASSSKPSEGASLSQSSDSTDSRPLPAKPATMRSSPLAKSVPAPNGPNPTAKPTGRPLPTPSLSESPSAAAPPATRPLPTPP